MSTSSSPQSENVPTIKETYRRNSDHVTGRSWWGIYLAEPNTFIIFLINERRRQERQSQRRRDDGRSFGRLQGVPLLALKAQEGATNPGKQAASHSLERQGKELSAESRKNRVILTP